MLGLMLPLGPVAAQDTTEVSVLVLIADFFGWNYFDVRDTLLGWGANVTTVAYSLDYNISSCLNREPRPIIADLLLSEIDNETLMQFDCLFIPAGGQWQSLLTSETVKRTIETAYQLGLSVASICIGNRVTAGANNIVNGTSVVNYLYSNTYMMNEGATVRFGPSAVSDNRIITGGGGGGLIPEGGFTLAPTEEVCAEVVREAMGLSYVTSGQIHPSSGGPGTNFTIRVQVTDQDEVLGGHFITDISEVSARIFVGHNRSEVASVPLTYNAAEDLFQGSWVASSVGSYAIDIEVLDSNSTLQITRNLVELSVGGLNVPLVLTAAGGISVLVAAVVIILRRRSPS